MAEALSSLFQLTPSVIDRLVTWLRQEKALTIEEAEQVWNDRPSARPGVLRQILLCKGGPSIRAVEKFFEENPGVMKLKNKTGLQRTFKDVLHESRIPDLPPHFVPRPGHERKVREGLLEAPQSAVLVHGLGGCGKTTLLIAVLQNDLLLDGVGRVVWLHVGALDGEVALLEKLNNLCRYLNGTRRAALEEFPGVLDKLCDELTRQTNQPPPLIILDNVWNENIFGYLSTRFRLLVSSRSIPTNRNFSLSLDLSKGFVEGESVQLFSKALKVPEADLRDAVYRLINSCASLPLAVALMAQVVSKESSNVTEECDRLVKLIADRKLQPLPPVVKYYCGDSDADWTLFGIVSLSLEELRQDRGSWFKALSFFAAIEVDTWVPEAVLEPFWPVTDPAMVRDLVSEELVDKSLLLTHKDEKLLFRMHSIVHAALKELLTAEEIVEKHQLLVNKYKDACSGRWRDLEDDGYVLRHLCSHMRAARLDAMAVAALKDFRFVVRRLQSEGSSAAVVEDVVTIGHEDPVLRGLAALLRDPRSRAATGRYRADLRQVCALLPAGHEVRRWAEVDNRQGLWETAEGQGAVTTSWEAVVHHDHQLVTALAVADHFPDVLVAVKRPRGGAEGEAVVLESDTLRVLAWFQLDSKEVFERAALANEGRSLLLATRKGELFACSLPNSLQELVQLHRAAPRKAMWAERLLTRRMHTDGPILLVASRRQALVTVSEQGRLSLHSLNFQDDGGCSLHNSFGHEIQLDWMAGPHSATSPMEMAVVRSTFEKLEDCMSGAETFPSFFRDFSRLKELIPINSSEDSKCDLAVSPCGNFVAALRNESIAVLQIQNNTMQLLYEAQRPRNISCMCFMTLPRSEDDSTQTLIVEVVGGCVIIRKVDEKEDVITRIEFCNEVSALTSDGNVLFVFSGQTFSMWSLNLNGQHQQKSQISFKDGCAFLCFAKFPIFISGISGSLAQLREKADFGQLKQFCTSDLQAEVLRSQQDLFLVEDVSTHGVKMTNLRTETIELNGLISNFKSTRVIHGLSTNAGKLAIADFSGKLHIFDVLTNTKTTLSVSKMCTAICPCYNGCLFVGFDDGSVSIKRSDSSEFIEISGSERYFVKYLIPIDTCQELASVSFGPDGCKIRVWSNIKSADGPRCKIDVTLSCQLPKMIASSITITMFTETHTACPAVSPNGRYMAVILPSSKPPPCASLLVVIDLQSGRHRKEMWSIMSQGNVQLVELGGSVWLLAISDRKVLRANIDRDGFFDGVEPYFTQNALLLDERLKLLTPCGQREMIVTSSDAITIWEMGAEGQLVNGRLLVPRSVVAGDFVASYANDGTLVIVTQTKSYTNFYNHFYVLKQK